MLNLLEMQVFVVAAETENFSEAARRLHLSQPAVSQRIHSLERHLGIRLFRRSGRSVELTDEGLALLPMARDLLATGREIEETMWALEGEVAGHVTIGCTTTAGKYGLPLLAARFNREYPMVRITIDMCQCDSVLQSLLAQEVQVAISDTRIVHRDIECQPFFTDQVVLIVPAGHPFAERASLAVGELLGQRFIMREEGCSTWEMVEQGLAEHHVHVDELDVVMSVGNSEAIVMAVEHGLGIAFVSRVAAIRVIESGRVVVVPVEGLNLERLLHVVRNASSSTTPGEGALWWFVAEHREEIVRALEI
jgi:DNA-binding transcriptional LysR family regulator